MLKKNLLVLLLVSLLPAFSLVGVAHSGERFTDHGPGNFKETNVKSQPMEDYNKSFDEDTAKPMGAGGNG